MNNILLIGSLRSPPLSRFAGLPPRESVSHDSQVATLPYESCSLATLFRGQNKPPRSNYFISSVKHSAARISPSGGDAAKGGRRGAFPTPVRAVCLFSLARQGGCTVLYKLAPLLFQRRLPPPERSDATLLYNPWHRGPEGPMDAIRPSAPKAQAPAGIRLPRRLVINAICLIYYSYQDPSLSLRMTVGGGTPPIPVAIPAPQLPTCSICPADRWMNSPVPFS